MTWIGAGAPPAASVPPHHIAAVDAELARLDATVAAGFAGSIDVDRASTADRQGLGGPAEWEALTQSRGVPG